MDTFCNACGADCLYDEFGAFYFCPNCDGKAPIDRGETPMRGYITVGVPNCIITIDEWYSFKNNTLELGRKSERAAHALEAFADEMQRMRVPSVEPQLPREISRRAQPVRHNVKQMRRENKLRWRK